MSTSKKNPKATFGSKTTNVNVVLELLKDVGKLGEGVPYLEGVAGILKTVIEMKQEYTASKEAWATTMKGVDEIRKIIKDSLVDSINTALPLPAHLKDAMDVLEKCLLDIADALDRIDSMNGLKRFVRRRELKADAEGCAADVGRALELFRTKLQIKLAFQVNAIYASIGDPAASIQVTLPVCPSASDFFTGRVTQLEKLRELLHESHTGRRVVTIIGQGGSGKTQLALKFVDQYKSRFSGVFFVDATSSQTIQTALGLIAKAHNAGISVEDARNWFSGHAEEWLLIFDNADDPSLNIGQYIPRSSHGNILITSRNHEVLCHASPDCFVLLPDLEELDAVTLLLKLAHLEDLPGHCALALDIVNGMGCLALAVSHAGTYISQSCSLQNYLPLFQSHRSDLLKRKRVQSSDDYIHTVFSAFELSYLQLTEQTKFFLYVLSFFHYSNIPLQIFAQAAGKVFNPDWSTPGRQYLRDFLSSYCDAQNKWQLLLFQDTLEELQQFSIISWNKESATISLHSMIHACVQHVEGRNDTSHVIALELLYATAPADDNLEDVMLCIMLASHADHLWNSQSIPSIFSADTKIREKLANILNKAGNASKEVSLRLDIIEIQKEMLGEQHPDSWSSMNNLANTYRKLGHLQEAEQLQEKVLSLQRDTLGEQHLNTWISMNNLALTYYELGRLHEAEQLQENVLSLQRETLGEQHPDTWSSMGNLASTYYELGRLYEAEQLDKKVLSLQRQTLGEQHPETWSSMNNLASTYYKLGRLHEAEQLQEKVLSLWRETFGEQHPNNWTSMNNLALTYYKLGRLHEAEQLQEKALSLRRETLGESHPDTWQSMNNLADIYKKLNRIQEAEQLQKKVAQLQKGNTL